MLDSEKIGCGLVIVSFCRIISLKNGLDILNEYGLEYLYADFYFLCCYPFKDSPYPLSMIFVFL